MVAEDHYGVGRKPELQPEVDIRIDSKVKLLKNEVPFTMFWRHFSQVTSNYRGTYYQKTAKDVS